MSSNSRIDVVINAFASIGGYIIFFKETIVWSFRPPFDWKNIIYQMLEIGYKSLPVTLISIISTGMVMSLQIGHALNFIMSGASVFIGSAISKTMFRELGPVLTALLLAGRVGSAIAAEIGTMKVTEQIDALRTLAANPIQYLSVPRFIAALTMVPTITVLTTVMGVIGGVIPASMVHGVTADKYFENLLQYTTLYDLFSGLIKSVFFGMEIAIISCYQGFATTGGAEGVGRSTIRAVVLSSVAILVSDYFLTYFMAFFE